MILSTTIVYTDHSALRHLFNKQDVKPRLIRWILLLQEFDIGIKDKKGTKNVAADNLSQIENDEMSDKSDVDDNFPRETLMEITTKDEPWFADFANYLEGDVIPKGMTCQKIKNSSPTSKTTFGKILTFSKYVDDKKGTKNVAADNLSRIENDETSDKSGVDDNFPRETLMEITTKDVPWFADFANYLEGDVIPKGMTCQQNKKFFSDLKNYFWEDPYLFKIWYDEDVHDLIYVETEFPAIVFNDSLTSDVKLTCEPTVSPLNDNKIDFRISFDESDDEDYTVIYDKNSFSNKIIFVEDLKTDSENDNEKVNMPSFSSPKPMVSYFDDLDFLKDFVKEFPAIVYNDAVTSKLDFLTESTVSPQYIDEFNLKDEASLSECDEEEQNVLYFNDLFPFNVIYPDDSKSNKENDDDKIDIKQSSGYLAVKKWTICGSLCYTGRVTRAHPGTPSGGVVNSFLLAAESLKPLQGNRGGKVVLCNVRSEAENTRQTRISKSYLEKEKDHWRKWMEQRLMAQEDSV
ncbi:hypothetical protein Tco_1300942 [Tanacetum coccineum]